MQSIATTISAKSSESMLNSTDLQYFINHSSILQLNTYCHKIQPVRSGTAVESGAERDLVHPIVQPLLNMLEFGRRNPGMKNVDLLVEAERISTMIGIYGQDTHGCTHTQSYI
jgi:hypothetical protein